MKRTRVHLQQVADWHMLTAAAHRAARGKGTRPAVVNFFSNFEASIANVRGAVLQGRLPRGTYREFTIHDPKERVIHAAPFADRVVHHALMHWLAPPLDNWLIDTSFACREGKGVHRAVDYAQRQCRRFPVYVKLDISGYFEHIDHGILRALLKRRIAGASIFRLIESLLASYHNAPGRGLPIGALSSQHFANMYLNPADRWAMDQPAVAAHVRYMDDTILWCSELSQAREIAQGYSEFVARELALDIKPVQIQHSAQGLPFCGCRIFPHRILASRRRLRRYRQRISHWERAWQLGAISSQSLQRNTDSVIASLAPAQSLSWRRRNQSNAVLLEV